MSVSSGTILIPRLYIGVRLTSNVSKSCAKSGMFLLLLPGFFSIDGILFLLAYIQVEGARSVLDPNPMPPGLYQYSHFYTTTGSEDNCSYQRKT